MNTNNTLGIWAIILLSAGIVGSFGLALRISFLEVKQTNWLKANIGAGVLLLAGSILGLLAKTTSNTMFIIYGLLGLAFIIIPIVLITREKRKEADKSIPPSQ